MYIPDFIRKAKSGDILATKYGNLLMVARVEIEEKSVCIYHYFDWDKDTGFQMNEWLEGFYGPRYIESENFYRPATDEEKTFFLDKLKEFGYELRGMYGNMVPQLTADGYKKFYRTRGEIQSNAKKYIDAEKLKAEIERRKELLENGTAHTEVMKRVEGVLKGYNSTLDIIASLQQEQQTDKQVVVITESYGDANIKWDCRSLGDVMALLKSAESFISAKRVRERK